MSGVERSAGRPLPPVRPAGTWRDLRAWRPALVAAGTLGLGYTDLARGGTTLSATLLVAGYAVVVPWAIMTSGRSR